MGEEKQQENISRLTPTPEPVVVSSQTTELTVAGISKQQQVEAGHANLWLDVRLVNVEDPMGVGLLLCSLALSLRGTPHMDHRRRPCNLLWSCLSCLFVSIPNVGYRALPWYISNFPRYCIRVPFYRERSYWLIPCVFMYFLALRYHIVGLARQRG